MTHSRKPLLSASALAHSTPILCALAFAAIAIAGFFAVIRPEIEQYQPGGPLDVQAKRQIVENRKQYLSDLKKLNQLYTAYGAGDASALSVILPGAKDLPALFAGYESLARRMKFGLQSIDIISADGKVKGSPAAKEIIVALKLDSVDYAKFKELLHILENSSRLTDIISFDIQPDSKFANITLKTYYASN